MSCLTLCDPMESHPPGSSVHGILHEKLLEWVVKAAELGDNGTLASALSRPFDATVPFCEALACSLHTHIYTDIYAILGLNLL